MAVTRPIATEAALRDPRAMASYINTASNHTMHMSLEMEVIRRSAGRRLKFAQSRGALMTQKEKDQAARTVERNLRRAALLLNHATKFLATAGGVLEDNFVPRGRNNQNNNRGNNRGGNRNNQGGNNQGGNRRNAA